MRPVELLRQLPDDPRAGGVSQALQLLEMLDEEMASVRPLSRRADENGAFDGGSEVDQISGDN